MVSWGCDVRNAAGQRGGARRLPTAQAGEPGVTPLSPRVSYWVGVVDLDKYY